MRLETLLLFSLSLSWSVVAAASASPPTPYEPLSLTLEDLLAVDENKQDVFQTALSTTGLLAIAHSSDEDGSSTTTTSSSSLASRALVRWCRCAKETRIQEKSADGGDGSHLQTLLLQDGVTRRTTLATATVGSSSEGMLALGHEGGGVCDGDDDEDEDIMEDLRDDMAVVSDAVVRALDRVLSSGGTHKSSSLLYDTHGRSYDTVSSIVRAATHLEHFHLYEKSSRHASVQNERDENEDANDEVTDTLAFHTDAGLFLLFVPGYDCRSSSRNDDSSSSSFWITDEEGAERPVRFTSTPTPPRAVLMMGLGAERWLSSSSSGIRATRHAVRMRHGETRAWYGKMHLVPDDAIIQTVPTTKTFQELKQDVVTTSLALTKNREDRRHDDDDDTRRRLTSPSLGCGDVYPDPREDDALEEVTTTHRRRRRLQHVGSPSECNNATNFFCWYQCLDIPDADHVAGYLNEGYSLYCLDPAVLASSGNRVSQATEPCQRGYVHNGACQGSWQPTAPGVATTVSFDQHQQHDDGTTLELEYCYGGVSMYMDGFHWVHDTLCVIYLFPRWVLDSRTKLAMASVGTLFMGVLLEGVIWQRRKLFKRMKAGTARLGMGSAFYGVQLTLGYFIMLIVMTYSGVLFLCCVAGLVLGNVMFNGHDGLLATASPSSGRRASVPTQDLNEGLPNPCLCADDKTDAVAGESAAGGGEPHPCCRNGDGDEDDIPEGATPCCQYSAA